MVLMLMGQRQGLMLMLTNQRTNPLYLTQYQKPISIHFHAQHTTLSHTHTHTHTVSVLYEYVCYGIYASTLKIKQLRKRSLTALEAYSWHSFHFRAHSQ